MLLDEFTSQTCRRCGWTGMTLARQVRLGVAVGLLMALVLLSLVGGPRWILWLLGAGGFVAVATTKELCPSCGAGPNDLAQPKPPAPDKPAT